MMNAKDNYVPLVQVLEVSPFILTANLSDFETLSLVGLLSEAEHDRMLRFRHNLDAQRYMLAHALKRAVLAIFLGIPQKELVFGTNGYGKPFCQNDGAPCFNLSHSCEWVALAVSNFSEVGVDLEFPRRVDVDRVLKRISSDSQMERYNLNKPTMRDFLCFWTQKEAVSKAHGRGISVGLSGIPCSGTVGVEEVLFLLDAYHLETSLIPNEGVLSYAATSHVKPAIIRVGAGQCETDPFYYYYVN